jgi:hypothetical protein
MIVFVYITLVHGPKPDMDRANKHPMFNTSITQSIPKDIDISKNEELMSIIYVLSSQYY